MAKLTHCKVCGTELSNGAKICPQCGQPRRKPFYRRIWFILLVIIVALNAVRSFNAARNERLHEQNGYGIFTLADGTQISARDINALYDESPVAAKNTYAGQTATVTMEVTSISDWAIEDYISLIRFSYSDYTLTHWAALGKAMLSESPERLKISAVETGTLNSRVSLHSKKSSRQRTRVNQAHNKKTGCSRSRFFYSDVRITPCSEPPYGPCSLR